MLKIIFISVLTLSLNAETYDKTYACIAFEKVSNNKTEKLDVNQSMAQGGYYRFSMKINFLRAIVSRDKDTINDIEYEDVRFAYRATIRDFDLFYHDYDKEYFIIKNDYPLKPYLSMVLDDVTKINYLCQAYTE